MKLNEIKTVITGEYILNEGVIPVHLTMTLAQVVNDGKITNNVQYFVIAGLISMFKDASILRWPRDINAYSMSTDANMIEALKTLTSLEISDLCKWLLEQLQDKSNFENSLTAFTNAKLSTPDWVRWVLRRQD